MLTDPIKTKETNEVVAKAQSASVENIVIMIDVETSSIFMPDESPDCMGLRTVITPKSTSSTKYAY